MKSYERDILTTDRLLLRAFEETDAEAVYELAKDPQVGPRAGWPPHTSVQNSRQIIREVLAARENYAICRKSDEALIGCIGIMIGANSHLQLPQNEGEIGYWLGRPYWGNGYMTEALTVMVQRGFEKLQLDTLWCGYFDGNELSKNVQKKCGFVYDHTNSDMYWSLTNEIKTEHINVLRK